MEMFINIRKNIYGINHLLFYQTPKNPQLFPYLVNLIKIQNDEFENNIIIKKNKTTKETGNLDKLQIKSKINSEIKSQIGEYSCRILFSMFDGHSLKEIVGNNMLKKLIHSNSQHVLYPNSI